MNTLGQRTHTLRNECRDFVEWHRGRGPYFLWAIDLDLPDVRQRVAMAAQAMQDLLLEAYTRQPHVTVALCGFPAKGDGGADEFSEAFLERQINAMHEASHIPPSFELQIGQLATFDSALFLAVDDLHGGIAAIREGLMAAGRAGDSPQSALDGDMPHRYLPHVTVGLYRDSWPLTEVHERIEKFANPAPLVVQVDRLSLLAYDPRKVGGALTAMGEFSLEKGLFRLLSKGP